MTLSTDSAAPNDGLLRLGALGTPDDVGAVDDTKVIDAPAPDVPDRADAPVSEITERFFKVVLAHIPLDRIEELHLFSPLRQGGVETGIAVVAARVPIIAVELPAAPELPFEDTPVGDTPDRSVQNAGADALAVEVMSDIAVAGDSDIADQADVLPDAEDEAVVETAPVPRIRHTVYTARYRLVQKGPERGKWEAVVVAEAEAPLITVDLVVRGVQRRAGEESEIVRYSAPQLARALRVPFPAV